MCELPGPTTGKNKDFPWQSEYLNLLVTKSLSFLTFIKMCQTNIFMNIFYSNQYFLAGFNSHAFRLDVLESGSNLSHDFSLVINFSYQIEKI